MVVSGEDLFGCAMLDKKKRRTPIERYIEDGTLDRRSKWQKEQERLGVTRITLRVHRDDVVSVKAYCAAVLAARLRAE